MRDFNTALDKEIKDSFYKWKIAALNEDLRRRTRDLHVSNGLGKVSSIHQRQPRQALRSVNKNREHKVKSDDAVKKLLFIYKNGLRSEFDKWADKD
jgi:hypothetical protein